MKSAWNASVWNTLGCAALVLLLSGGACPAGDQCETDGHCGAGAYCSDERVCTQGNRPSGGASSSSMVSASSTGSSGGSGTSSRASSASTSRGPSSQPPSSMPAPSSAAPPDAGRECPDRCGEFFDGGRVETWFCAVGNLREDCSPLTCEGQWRRCEPGSQICETNPFVSFAHCGMCNNSVTPRGNTCDDGNVRCGEAAQCPAGQTCGALGDGGVGCNM